MIGSFWYSYNNHYMLVYLLAHVAHRKCFFFAGDESRGILVPAKIWSMTIQIPMVSSKNYIRKQGLCFRLTMTGCFHQKLNRTESQRTLNKQVAIRL